MSERPRMRSWLAEQFAIECVTMHLAKEGHNMRFLRYMTTLFLAGAVCIACFANFGNFDGKENGTGTYL